MDYSAQVSENLRIALVKLSMKPCVRNCRAVLSLPGISEKIRTASRIAMLCSSPLCKLPPSIICLPGNVFLPFPPPSKSTVFLLLSLLHRKWSFPWGELVNCFRSGSVSGLQCCGDPEHQPRLWRCRWMFRRDVSPCFSNQNSFLQTVNRPYFHKKNKNKKNLSTHQILFCASFLIFLFFSLYRSFSRRVFNFFDSSKKCCFEKCFSFVFFRRLLHNASIWSLEKWLSTLDILFLTS